MDDRTKQFRVGVTVLAAILLTGILVLLFGETPNFFQRRYTVFISFDDGSGVTRDTPIKKSGITIGRVSNVELKDDAGALVTAEIDSDRTLMRNEVPRISGSIIGGDAFIDFRKRDDLGLSSDPIKPGDILVGEDKVDPTSILSDIEDPMNRALILRFVWVNLFGAMLAWAVSSVMARHLLPALGWTFYPFEGAHLCGVAAPAITSYFLHKYYTFAADSTI